MKDVIKFLKDRVHQYEQESETLWKDGKLWLSKEADEKAFKFRKVIKILKAENKNKA